MKSASEFEKVLIHREPVDMRRGINGLCELVGVENMGDLMKPHLFVFCGKRRHSIKVLYFDKSGFAMWQKKLEKARFHWPKKFEEKIVTLTPEYFDWLLSGYDVWKMKPFEKLNFEKLI
jgi:transposase